MRMIGHADPRALCRRTQVTMLIGPCSSPIAGTQPGEILAGSTSVNTVTVWFCGRGGPWSIPKAIIARLAFNGWDEKDKYAVGSAKFNKGNHYDYPHIL